MTTVHVVVPAGLDDPTRRSGGNVFDRHLCNGLRVIGWRLREHEIPGAWPSPTPAVREPLARLLSELDDGAVVLLDGLIGSSVPDLVVPQSDRLRLVVLVHLPLGLSGAADVEAAMAKESEVLGAAAAVITPSGWTRSWLLEQYALKPDRVHVAEPGVDAAVPAPGTEGGGELLCVAAVTPHKGQDVLLAALCGVADLRWRCHCVGSLTRDPGFAAAVNADAARHGVGDRFLLTGPRTGADLDGLYASADALVLPSRTETYGMVVTEALAHGLPVIATDVGGVPEALGFDREGRRPGILVPPDDPAALTGALRRWLEDADLRHRLRGAVRGRRATLPSWAAAADRVSHILAGVAS